MKLILKDKMAYLSCQGYVPNQPLPVDIDLPGFNIEEYKMIVKINDLPSRSCVRSFTIPLPELQKPKLKIDVKVRHKKKNVSVDFHMDPLKLQMAVLIGDNIEDQYPATLNQLRADLKATQKTANLTSKAVIEIGKRGEII